MLTITCPKGMPPGILVSVRCGLRWQFYDRTLPEGSRWSATPPTTLDQLFPLVRGSGFYTNVYEVRVDTSDGSWRDGSYVVYLHRADTGEVFDAVPGSLLNGPPGNTPLSLSNDQRAALLKLVNTPGQLGPLVSA